MNKHNLPGAWVLETFRRGGVDIEELTKRLPDDVNYLLFHMDSMPPDSTSRLLECCAAITGNQDFGLDINDWVDISMYGLLGYLLLNSETVHGLFNTLVRYYLVHQQGGDYYKLDIHKNTAAIEYGFNSPCLVDPRHSINWALGFIPHFIRSELGDSATPLSAQFTYKRPCNLEKLQALFGRNLTFNQPENRLIYPRSILNRHISDTDPQLLDVLYQRADNYLLELAGDDCLVNTIQPMIFEKLSQNRTTADDIAKSLNMSLSTFKRLLVKEGISFKQIKETVRDNTAKELLTETNIKIADVAEKTGFANQSSFTRFFIRINQLSPHKYRQLTKVKQKMIR